MLRNYMNTRVLYKDKIEFVVQDTLLSCSIPSLENLKFHIYLVFEMTGSSNLRFLYFGILGLLYSAELGTGARWRAT